MARRTVWLATGVIAGAASSLYAERKLKRTIEAAAVRLAPDALAGQVTRTAREAAKSTGGRVRAAVATGRTEMQRREEEIWAGLEASESTSTRDLVITVATDPDVPAPPAGSEVPASHAARGRGRRRPRRSASHLGK